MAHKCVVSGCPNSSDTIIHYILPEEPRRRRLWLQFIERSEPAGGSVPESCRVCGDHFSADSFTQLDLGFTTRVILNVDAVPTIYPEDRVTKGGNEEQVADPKNEAEETFGLAISGTISLACVKEEHFEYEVSQITKPLEQTASASIRCTVKQEEKEGLLSAGTCAEGSEQRRVIRRAANKCESGHNALDEGVKEDKRFSCSTCGEKFSNKHVLMEHERNHMEEQTVSTHHCHQCGEGFEHLDLLKAHEKLHMDDEANLPQRQISCRLRVRHNRPPQPTYKCPICNKVYQQSAMLTRHVKIAHAGCKLMCSFCENSFVQIDAFFKHIDRHLVETPYYCSTCRVYQLTKRGYVCHLRIHEKKRLLKTNALNASNEVNTRAKARGGGPKSKCSKWNKDLGTRPAPGSQVEAAEEHIKVQMQTEEASKMEPELVLGAESVAELEKVRTVQVPELEKSLPSPEELSYTDASGESEDTEDSDGTNDL